MTANSLAINPIGSLDLPNVDLSRPLLRSLYDEVTLDRRAKDERKSNGAIAMTLGFLRALRERTGGMTAEDVQHLLNADHPKGVGSKLSMVNACLVNHGFKHTDTVYKSVRSPVDGRRWYPESSITDAIIVLDRVGGAATS